MDRQRTGFTLVEAIVVVAITALLIGLLLPAIGGAHKQSRKRSELAQLRLIGAGWVAYANSSDDRILPGMLEREVQEAHRMHYRYPGGQFIPPAPGFEKSLPDIAGPWPWRLLPFMDWRAAALTEHRELADGSITAAVDDAEMIARQPAYGYNTLFVGGWHYDADSPPWLHAHCVQSLSALAHPDHLVTFCSSSLRDQGLYRDTDDNLPGWHSVSPPDVCGDLRWSQPGQVEQPEREDDGTDCDPETAVGRDRFAIQVHTPLVPDAAGWTQARSPIGRHTGQTATLFADGHVESVPPGTLSDLTCWVNDVTRRGFVDALAPPWAEPEPAAEP